jgi:hypothetical protein
MVAFTAGAVLTAANLNTAFNALTIRTVTGTSDTLVLDDNGGAVSYSNASRDHLDHPAELVGRVRGRDEDRPHQPRGGCRHGHGRRRSHRQRGDAHAGAGRGRDVHQDRDEHLVVPPFF